MSNNKAANIDIGHLALWGIILFVLSYSIYMMADIASPYLKPPYPTDIDFLQSKQSILEQPFTIQIPIGEGEYRTLLFIPYLWAFYIHITSSVIALATGITQFSRRLMFQYKTIHQWMGRIYVFAILFLAAPSGLIMAFYGNGGWAAQWAFVLQSLAWWGLTYVGYRKARQKDFLRHGEFIFRSYALALSAISLRFMSYGIFWFEDYHSWRYPDTYILIAWGSWTLNLVIAELMLMGGLMKYYFPKK